MFKRNINPKENKSNLKVMENVNLSDLLYHFPLSRQQNFHELLFFPQLEPF